MTRREPTIAEWRFMLRLKRSLRERESMAPDVAHRIANLALEMLMQSEHDEKDSR